MIVSFRGTQMEWKDLLTDMLIMQEGLDEQGGTYATHFNTSHVCIG